MIARRPQLLPVSGGSVGRGGGDDLRRRGGGEYRRRCALSFSRGGSERVGVRRRRLGDAYVRVARAQAVRAPRVTAGGDSAGGARRDWRRVSPPPPAGGDRRRPLPLPPSSGDPLRPAFPAGGRASISPARAQPGLVCPAPLAAASGLIPALGPILQMAKLTHGALNCLALGP